MTDRPSGGQEGKALGQWVGSRHSHSASGDVQKRYHSSTKLRAQQDGRGRGRMGRERDRDAIGRQAGALESAVALEHINMRIKEMGIGEGARSFARGGRWRDSRKIT